ncbi:peptide-methionine (R)-S-oxide reductase MsrB [Mucilaginibacter gotjawali]|uniref:Peptide-methionine (R)-S-oxide reductase/peptide methionine sulfoxide reductase msrA/msrB n=2 Tax=Mucilaginibacter gotjawali TaxID=1550579 RepID=A0A839SGI2_9SPHI|nr:peptide-methionine (R)-S-oxide reductase MsrB [Mucilaginibacter gotjawali]MBB3055699.1 peptide-methionine (R)-S-oxide reductase/peptide methionine sulfoxide reductase msrA/msrB [Mucilaginibacter gotjawali]BAU54518.1 Peptide methionine sulfoxide reductase MsrA/MsrB [Mucilaginibacter gotjawali]
MKKSILALLLVSMIAALGCQPSSGQQLKKFDPKRKMSKAPAEWKKTLTSNQYYIMVESGTEPPYQNAYFNNHEKGVYVSAATGEVLFSSDDKYDSGTGWPSFVKPVDPKKIEIVTDNSDGMVRDEVIERSTGLHLGHVFDDGPQDRGGKRYCMNSGALKFIKK